MTQFIDCPPSERSHDRTLRVDYGQIKERQRAMWASGDFAVIGTTLQIVGESLCEAVDLPARARVLDVACGNGNATLAAARRFCRVTGVDYVPSLLERGAARARAEGLDVDFIEGDAENLPFPDESFDVALSTYGVMFAPDQQRAADELTRVVRKGGKIGLANWTPDGFIGALLKTVGKHVPPPPGVASPVYWGSEERLAELFPNVRAVHTELKHFVFRCESADHFIDLFRTYYGPTHKAFAALDTNGKAALARDIRAAVERFARPTGPSIAIPGAYLEVVIER